MPKRVDLDALLRSLVAREVKAVLAPHLGLLERLQKLLDGQPSEAELSRELSTSGAPRPAARQAGRRPRREVVTSLAQVSEPRGSAESAPVQAPAIKAASDAEVAPPAASVFERIKPVIRRKAEVQASPATDEQGPIRPAARFAEGQVVRVRDGGELVDAEVLALATSTGVALIKRLHDGKKVEVKSTEIHSSH